jgi:hypothetical protein
MIKEISLVIENLVGQIDNTIVGQWNDITQKIEICNTKWARSGKPISQIGGDYVIDEVETDEYITIKDQVGLTGTFYIPQPYFLGGTRIAANREWTISTPDLLSKTPIIWLLHDINYKVFGRNNTEDWESTLRLFFLDETNVVNYYTKDHTTNVVEPMTQLANEFVDIVEKDKSFKTLEEYEVINFTRFGTESQGGSFQNILDANLSGVELRITLTKYKGNCVCY